LVDLIGAFQKYSKLNRILSKISKKTNIFKFCEYTYVFGIDYTTMYRATFLSIWFTTFINDAERTHPTKFLKDPSDYAILVLDKTDTRYHVRNLKNRRADVKYIILIFVFKFYFTLTLI